MVRRLWRSPSSALHSHPCGTRTVPVLRPCWARRWRVALALVMPWPPIIENRVRGPQTGITGIRLFFHGLSTALQGSRFFSPPIYYIYGAILRFGSGPSPCWHSSLLNRARLSPVLMVAAFAVIPLFAVLSHWAENEQRGHRFGFGLATTCSPRRSASIRK